MEVRIDLRGSVTENAQLFYEKAKKAKKKMPGLEKAIEETEEDIGKLTEKIKKEGEKGEKTKKEAVKKKRWYEKFRWFTSSDGFLVVGGKDATSNEVLIKKHTQPQDMVFHADIQGAPFFVVKNPEKAEIPEKTLQEASNAAASYSSAWKKGLGAVDVYYINPGQVSKTAESGEYVAKGAFVIRGRKEWFRKTELKVAVGVSREEGSVVGGPVSAVEALCDVFVVLSPGDLKQGDAAKKAGGFLRHNHVSSEVEDGVVQQFIPGGKSRIIK